MEIGQFVAAVSVAYILGSIPSGLLVGKVFQGIDLREYGSGKTGATNALRTLGVGPALLVIAMDMVKGLLALVIAHALSDSIAAESVAGLAAAAGHNWPVFAQFRGGRGVLVSFAIFLVLCWPAALACALIGIALIALSRYVSLGVLVGTGIGVVAAMPVVITGHASPWVLLYTIVGAALIIARHWDNIERLRDGTERKLGQPALPVGC
jgi:glycerol-3-phosphate acyltransferase PlsY